VTCQSNQSKNAYENTPGAAKHLCLSEEITVEILRIGHPSDNACHASCKHGPQEGAVEGEGVGAVAGAGAREEQERDAA